MINIGLMAMRKRRRTHQDLDLLTDILDAKVQLRDRHRNVLLCRLLDRERHLGLQLRRGRRRVGFAREDGICVRVGVKVGDGEDGIV